MSMGESERRECYEKKHKNSSVYFFSFLFLNVSANKIYLEHMLPFFWVTKNFDPSITLGATLFSQFALWPNKVILQEGFGDKSIS
jgi:hypothetical protein